MTTIRKLIQSYNNGNADITIYDDGTRHIEYEGTLKLEYPLNIDIRVMTKCSFGFNPKTGKSICSFCHESATTIGKECDYVELKEKLKGLPQGIELAIGANYISEKFTAFLYWCKLQGFIVNLTINQGHLNKYAASLRNLIISQTIKGLGISYRSSLKWSVPQFFLDYPNTVFHCISGIDTVDDVIALRNKGVKKLLILGEKDFGFNTGNVDLKSQCHIEWYSRIQDLFKLFEIVSFDNLAVEQLNLKRFFTKNQWSLFYQGEHSMYINAVEQYYAPSSRDHNKTRWENLSIIDYFKNLNDESI